METKELKIQIPEGYEIDREKSTFECIKFKPIKKDITYEDVCEKLFKDSYHFIDGGGLINLYTGQKYKFNKNNASNHQQLKRILALNQLLNIAEYYNSNRKEDEVIYAIIYDLNECKFTVTSSFLTDIYSFGVVAIFYDEDDVKAVIDNPNFKEILDTIYKY
nr:MAG TPA: hypothetical protein [Crassvirales sp.]